MTTFAIILTPDEQHGQYRLTVHAPTGLHTQITQLTTAAHAGLCTLLAERTRQILTAEQLRATPDYHGATLDAALLSVPHLTQARAEFDFTWTEEPALPGGPALLRLTVTVRRAGEEDDTLSRCTALPATAATTTRDRYVQAAHTELTAADLSGRCLRRIFERCLWWSEPTIPTP